MRFSTYGEFLNEDMSEEEEQAVLKNCESEIESLDYEVRKGKFSNKTMLVFDGDGGEWHYEFNGSEGYMGYPGKNNVMIEIICDPEQLYPILKKVKMCSIPLHVINEFVELLGFEPAEFISRTLSTRNSSKESGCRMKSSRIVFPESLKKVVSCDLLEDFAGTFTLQVNFKGTLNFETYEAEDFSTDKFLLQFLEFVKPEFHQAKNIVQQFADQPIGSCLPALRKEFRGRISTRNFGI